MRAVAQHLALCSQSGTKNMGLVSAGKLHNDWEFLNTTHIPQP
jgi:hypothetical protein